ncbi:hypothetical protein Forpi1262_v015707 [Fusarium oxysporum f. sp. raphani]|uniref:Uncharacterized protein n=1 Tax=Fusarium oxysporum f. sp. raphani TaxID=96318 RepID=A0A8J5UGQ8_FUSOX|nr:hypothetical protein Forpi1262_v015707 [Fusarium oxysporum f. sp. raphani]
MGIDIKQTRRWNGRADDQVDEDETADSEGTKANSEPVDEIIALGPREDLGEYEDEDEEATEEDPDLTVEEEESAPHERNLWSRSRDIGGIQNDEPMEDTMAANPRSAPATTNGQSRTVLSPPAPAPTQPSRALALGAAFNLHLAWFMIPPRALFTVQRDQMNKLRRLLRLQLHRLFKARRSHANHQAPKRRRLSPLLLRTPRVLNDLVCNRSSKQRHLFLKPCTRPKLVQQRFNQEQMPPLQTALKEEMADAFLHWV